MENLKQKISELYSGTPDYVTSVSLGYKYKNNIKTNEQCIVFGVKQKKQLSEIPKNEILPTTVSINGKIFKTDVIELPEFKASVCWDYNPMVGEPIGTGNPDPMIIPHRRRQRPLKGGISTTNLTRNEILNVLSAGTLGLIVVDEIDNRLVGLTNNHVITENGFVASERNLTFNAINTYEQKIIQPADLDGGEEKDSVGKVKRYFPLTENSNNLIDAGLVTINCVDENSYNLLQTNIGYKLDFASSQEIDNLLSSNSPIIKAGRTTGPLGGTNCEIEISQINALVTVGGYFNNGSTVQVDFEDCLLFKFKDNSLGVGISGDSGSVIVGEINGTWKIVGLMFASDSQGSFGVANRIDKVEELLDIRPWTNTTKIKLNSDSPKCKKILPGLRDEKFIIFNGKKYWQIGTTTELPSAPCQANPQTTPNPTPTPSPTPVCMGLTSGEVLVHTDGANDSTWSTDNYANIVFTCPFNGSVNISGNIYIADVPGHNADRDCYLELYVDNNLLSAGNSINKNTNTIYNPFNFSDGTNLSGGLPSLTNVPVVIGSKIELRLKSTTSWGTFVGVNFDITNVQSSTVYSLKNDWNNTNPNGNWSYRSGSNVLSTLEQNWASWILPPNQSAFAPGNNFSGVHVPAFLKINCGTVSPTPTATPTNIIPTPTPVALGSCVDTPSRPSDVCIANNMIYVSCYNSNSAKKIDPNTMQVVESISLGGAPVWGTFDETNNKIYFSNNVSNSISVYDLTTNSVTNTIQLQGDIRPVGTVVNGSTNRLYVPAGGTNYQGDSLLVIDTNSNSVIQNIVLGIAPVGSVYAALHKTSKKLYVSNSSSNNVSVIDINNDNNSIIKNISVGTTPFAATIDETNNKVYISNFGSSSVSVIDTITDSVVTTIVVGNQPFGSLIYQNKLIVLNYGSGTISVIDTSNNTVVKTISVDGTPRGIGFSDSINKFIISHENLNKVCSVDLPITIDPSMSFKTLPQNITSHESNVTFNYSVEVNNSQTAISSGTSAVSYEWQYSDTNGNSWIEVVDADLLIATGVNVASSSGSKVIFDGYMNLVNFSKDIDGRKYRVKFNLNDPNYTGSEITSNIVELKTLLEPADQNYNRSNDSDHNHVNWGLLRHVINDNINNWGSP